MSIGGKVFLVGAGPGDPGLLTLKGLQCLKEADVVLYDGLVNPLLLQHTSAACERTARAERGADGLMGQDEINRRLVEAAKAGRKVVRLKGGDPYIFGRGSEEARALVDAGIPFEVVPGITAATASSVYAGISLTHRDSASAVAFVTGHEDPAKPESSLDYHTLANFRGTLVFYMGLARLQSIVEALVAHGKPANTPACVISRATTPLQRTVVGELHQLPQLVQQAELHAPSLTVIGECVNQRDSLAWFEHKPLFGQRIGITRPAHQTEGAIQLALDLGAQPVLMPTIEIRPPQDWQSVDAAIERLPEFDWLVFTSVNGVQALLRRIWDLGHDLRRLAGLKLAAIGPATADALAEFHLKADVVPPEYRAEALAAELVPLVADQRILWAGANRGRDILPNELRSAGATVEKVVVYENVDVAQFAPDTIELLERGELDWIMLTSPSIARNVNRLLPAAARAKLGAGIRLASISPVTTQAAVEVGLTISAEAQSFTVPGVFDAIMKLSP